MEKATECPHKLTKIIINKKFDFESGYLVKYYEVEKICALTKEKCADENCENKKEGN